MKGSSDNYPQIFVQSGGKTQFRFNIVERKLDDMGTERTVFDFDYVAIDGTVTRDKLIDAVISATFSKDAEIALINNEIASPGTSEYAEYQTFRNNAKTIVTAAGF